MFGPKCGIWSEALIAEKIHEQSLRTILLGTHRPWGGPGDTLMPPGIPQRYKGYGWHQDESRLILVTREPRMYRIPEDPSYGLRTTWLRTTKGWAQFEKQVGWSDLNPKTPKFEEWGEGSVHFRDGSPQGDPSTNSPFPRFPMSGISFGALLIQVRGV